MVPNLGAMEYFLGGGGGCVNNLFLSSDCTGFSICVFSCIYIINPFSAPALFSAKYKSFL